MNAQDAYVALGVPYGSSEEITRKAYRRLISAWHPDRNASHEAHGKTLLFNTAIAVLEKVGFKMEESDFDRSFHFTDGVLPLVQKHGTTRAIGNNKVRFIGLHGFEFLFRICDRESPVG